jgi:uncharacterized protein DUF6812
MEAQSGDRPRALRVVFETDSHVVVGNVTLPGEGYQGRLSDQVNRADVAFLPLLDVEVTAHGGGTVQRHPFLMLSKAHIRFAHPLASDQAPPTDAG